MNKEPYCHPMDDLIKEAIGSMGIYPFARIWHMTVPSFWQNQNIDTTIGKIN